MPKSKRKKDGGTKKEVKYKGVSKRGEKFQAQINIDGKQQYLGTFDTRKKAARAIKERYHLWETSLLYN